ncbi:alpha/beta hydrolase [Geomonas sp. Red276]
MNSTPLACHLSETETLRYRKYGNGPKRLVLLHGLASRSACWKDLVPLFPADRYTLYLVDLLGSGDSSKPKNGDYSMRGHSRRLIAFLEKEELAGVTVVGHSLGGAVTLMTAVELHLAGKEALVVSLVIMAGPGYLQQLPLIAELFGYPLVGRLFVAMYAPDIWIKVGLRAAYHDHSLVDREHIKRYAPCYRDRAAKRALVQTCRSLVPDDAEELASHFGDLRLPVLLLWGREDRIVPLSQGTRLNAVIPGSRLEIIEQCGHNPQEEKPRETFQIIDQFVRAMNT